MRKTAGSGSAKEECGSTAVERRSYSRFISWIKLYCVCGLGEGEAGGEDNGGETVRAAGRGP